VTEHRVVTALPETPAPVQVAEPVQVAGELVIAAGEPVHVAEEPVLVAAEPGLQAVPVHLAEPEQVAGKPGKIVVLGETLQISVPVQELE